MARFKIMSRNGSTVRYEGAPKYNGLFAKASYLEFAEIASPTPIDWQIGDYVDYSRTGFRYKLYTLPQVSKSGVSGEAGDSFVYKNVQFFCATKDLEIALFRDIVEYDNGIHFSSIPNVDTYEDVYGIINRIQANMDDFAPGEWTIRAMSTSYSEITNLMHEVKAFSLSDGTCMDALNQIYNLWKGLSWIYKVEGGRHTIVIGRPNLQDASNTTPEFSFGHGNGLNVITRAVSTKNEMATRIYAYGSDRNMPTRYYNNIVPYIKDYESVYIPHLMLPLTDWGMTSGQRDARLAYIEDSNAVNTYGLIPKVMRFDGSNGLDEIYPSIEGMTVSDVADEDFPATGWYGGERIDEVYGCENPEDDGMYTTESVKLKQPVIDLTVRNPELTIVTKPNQEAVTIGTDHYLCSSADVQREVNPYDSEGNFTIKIDGLHGWIRCEEAVLGDYLTDVPKAFLDVMINGKIQSSTEVKVTSTKIQEDFFFECQGVKFVTTAKGQLDIYLRIEMSLAPNTPSLTIRYDLCLDNEGVEIPARVSIRCAFTIPKTFKIFTRQLGFDLKALGTSLSEGLATLSMKTGMCAGRDFVVNDAIYNPDTHCWELECQRQDDTSLMQYFPNGVYTIEPDDRFVFVDVQMPTKYVVAASNRLRTAAVNALAKMCKPVMAYVPEVDSKEVFLASVTLVEGLYMPIYDPDLVETFISSEPNVNWILISSVTIAENDDVIPIYSVTLRDEKVDSMLQVITGELNATQKRLRDKDVDESRIPAAEDPEAILIPTTVGVKIQADTKMFVSDAEGDFTGQKITLTAVTTGINNPVFTWYYKVETIVPSEEEGGEDEIVEEWRPLEEEVAQAYIVEADSEIYFQGDKVWEDFRVEVTDGPRVEPSPDEGEGGEDEEPQRIYFDTIRISKGGRGPKGDDGDPGQDGWSKATITLYRRFPYGSPIDTRIGNTTYTFSTQELVGNLNGWAAVLPSTGSGPIYVTSVSVASQDDTVSIKGGWVTDYPAGDWSVPVRLTGDNGLMGKVMRGINVWQEGGLEGGRPDGTTDGYQGMDETDTSVIYYDVVAKLDENGNISNLYYCKDGSNGDAALYAPWTTAGAAYWVEADNFNFIATKVLLADNAFIDVMSGNAVYLYGDGGAGGSTPYVVAGMQGGSTDANGDPQVNFFAGTDGTNTDPQDAPFRVYYDGSFVSTAGRIGGYTYDENGLTYYRNVPGGNDGYHSIYQKDAFEILWRSQGRVNKVIGNVQPTANQVLKVSQGFSASKPALVVEGYNGSSLALDVTGYIECNSERVITSVDGNILKMAQMTQAAYDALATKDATTVYVIKD